jgi:hypothetical protein
MDSITSNQGGSMKSLTSLWSCVADELATRCCTSAIRDKKLVVDRTEHEGLSFLAITLADFGKAFEKTLDQGLVAAWECSSFETNALTGLPAFLQGFLRRVFNPSSGALLDNPDIEAIYAVRQLTLMFSKIALPTDPRLGGRNLVVTPDRRRRAMSEYVQCEQDVKAADAILDPLYREDFKRMSAMLFGDMFAKVDRDVHWNRIVPKHGPGAVADYFSQNEKWNQSTWPARLERVFPFDSHCIVNGRYSLSRQRRLDILEPGSETPVRVITVPKTLKTPRIIAIEPVAMQYMQQGLDRAFRSAIREDWFLSKVIGFDDQEPNRQMARSGSLSGDLATLDLSEASDRVSNQHVLAMLEDWPLLLEAVQATRSRKADVPGQGVQRLAKFASMGSALCFPMEAMVFLTVIFLGIERELSAPLSRGTLIRRFHEQVRVYGDDLIVPRDYVLSVVEALSVFGHKVNFGKSFWIGRYRESCGREYYDGQDVSIVKVREVLPTRRQDANAVVAAVSLRNRLYWAGLWKSAAFMDDVLEKILHKENYPNVAPTSALLGRESVLGYQFHTLDPNNHGPITKGYYVVAKAPQDVLEGAGALLKCLIRKEGDIGRSPGFIPPAKVDSPKVDDEHLERTGRPERVSIKLGRRSPF